MACLDYPGKKGRWFELHMPCPAPNCPNAGNGSVTKRVWRSAKCGGVMEINEKCYLRCEHHKDHQCIYDKMCNFRFDCGLRGPHCPHSENLSDPYVKGDRQSFSHALASAMAMSYLGGNDLAWVMEIMRSLDEMFPLK